MFKANTFLVLTLVYNTRMSEDSSIYAHLYMLICICLAFESLLQPYCHHFKLYEYEENS